MQNLSQLFHFRLVAQEGSFARAAEMANLSQPALSNSIKTLERNLGLQLLERTERPIRLTAHGRSVLRRVDILLSEARNLDQEFANLKSGKGGSIRIAMSTVFSTSLGGPIIAKWHNRNPDVKLKVDIGQTVDLVTGLYDDTYDLIVGDTRDIPQDTSDLDLVDLPAQLGHAFCRADHPILSIQKPQPSDIAQYRFATVPLPCKITSALAKLLRFEYSRTEQLFTIESDSIAPLLDATVESDLILLSTVATVRNALSVGLLKQIEVDLESEAVWSVASRKGRVSHPAAIDLIDTIVEISGLDNTCQLTP